MTNRQRAAHYIGNPKNMSAVLLCTYQIWDHENNFSMFYKQKGKIYCSKTIENNRKTLTKKIFFFTIG